MAIPAATVISLVVDVSSFTKRGFIGTSNFSGEPIEIEFDDGDEGIFLAREMAKRLTVRKGSEVSVSVEDETTLTVKIAVVGVGRAARFSSARIYFAVGKEGGAVIRVQKA